MAGLWNCLFLMLLLLIVFNTTMWLWGNSPAAMKSNKWLLTKQKWGTYSKSQDMKRFIIDVIIHCILAKIWASS